MFSSAHDADAYEYNRHGFGLRFSGEGMVGAAYPETIISDFRLRGQANYAVQPGWTSGVVYSIDELATSTGHFARDAFFLVESPMGRMELGVTNSIAAKLGLGLPDVGALRVNEYSIAYKITDNGNPIISNPVIDGGRYSLRANVVSVPTKPFQLGMSVVPWDPRFNTATDIGIKYRRPYGKTKLAASFGASYIDEPRGLAADIYAPRVTADSRSQIAVGLNIQYNSWNWGLTARGIYDYNHIGSASDGLQAGTGLSYDFLRFSASVSYILSEVGVWHDSSITTHTGIFSLRYKFDRHFDAWASGGLVSSAENSQPFVAGGLRARF